MVTLFETDLSPQDRRSSKGNQLKWLNGEMWYKADYAGYEGLSEYLVSNLLVFSNLKTEAFVLYEPEEICYGQQTFRGVRSRHFLKDGWQIITLERLFQNMYARSFMSEIYRISDTGNRLRFLVDQVEQMTGLKEFGVYMNRLLTIDAIFLNEDRHLHNIAVLMDEAGHFSYCPIFDHGACLLSDTTLDYPMGEDVFFQMERVKAKTVCADFYEQLECSEKLYGSHLIFSFDKKTIRSLLKKAHIYDKQILDRVETILYEQMRRYAPYIKP